MANGIVISVNIDEDKSRRTQRILRKLNSSISDLRPFFKDMGEFLVASTHRRFDLQMDPEGIKWPGYKSPSYARRKARLGRSPLLLIFSGDMKQSITHIETKKKLAVGTNKTAPGGFLYPAAQQLGNRNMPGRAFIGLSRMDLKIMEKKGREYLEAAGDD